MGLNEFLVELCIRLYKNNQINIARAIIERNQLSYKDFENPFIYGKNYANFYN